ncbi:MAG TPA: type IV toxin-antitoxin system AbiEi family antitoxin domain-containing protein [Thermoleophilaceae bacterium]|nr:type IV toxin-antitoxin system AbiEi family antitoxin domain-containing protein [Thermoleophilaceae bacterium]
MGSWERNGLEEAIAELAERQHGKVTRAQLRALGLGKRAIDYRLAKGWLRPDYRGVFSLGHRPESRESRWMAAVLHGGESAALSHWSAATHTRMRQGAGPRSHVTTPRSRRRCPDVTFHKAQLQPDEVTVHDDIPTTTPARTLLDLAPLLPSPILARMIEAAPYVPGAPLAVLLDRYPGKAGGGKLREIVAVAHPMTRSDLEAAVLEAIREAALPEPSVNAVVEGQEVDFVWWKERVIAELDTYVTHGSPIAFERDRKRDRELAIAGWTVVRLTDPRGVADLSRLLGASAARSRAAA